MSETKLAPIDDLKISLKRMEPQFAAALPSHVTPQKFARVLMTAVSEEPKLITANRSSLFAACLKAASHGLLPDKREAALVVFGSDVAYMPMVTGFMKLARNSGEISSINIQVVKSKDDFEYSLGDDDCIRHKTPALDKPRGETIGAYAIATLRDGSKMREVMSTEDIEKVRNVSRSKDGGPWKVWYDEMAKKTVFRRLYKRLPSSTDLDMALKDDNDTIDIPRDDQPSRPTPVAEPEKSRMETVIENEKEPPTQKEGEARI